MEQYDSQVVDFDDDDCGACLCPEFGAGTRQLHNLGQPGCAGVRE